MSTIYPIEIWKAVIFDFEYSNEFRLEVSNYGRLKTYNKISDGNIINGSMINGYRIVRLKFYTARKTETQKRLEFLQNQIIKLAKILKLHKATKASKKTIQDTEELLASLKKNLKKKYRDDVKKRTIHYHSLIHRLVADYFLAKSSNKYTIVAHIDYDKLNNHATNLKWMTPEENYAHQKGSPRVIQEKEERKLKIKDTSKVAKLTVTKVMLLKKMLNEGKPIKLLAKQFKISDTQILRIKRGENWATIEAAK